MRAMVMLGTALIASVCLTGCAKQAQEPAATPADPPSVTWSDTSNFTPPQSGVINEDTEEPITVAAVPQWDKNSQTAVVQAAEIAMATFAHPELDYDTWWAKVEPLMTPDAARNYVYVDPANIPTRQVTGPGVIIEDSSAYAVTVQVPTDTGRYHVLLIRKDADAPWLVSRLTPIEEAG